MNTVTSWGVTEEEYLVVPDDGRRCRLLAKLLVRYPRGPFGWILRGILPLGDLVMMRRQLLNLKTLAERDAAVAAPGS